MHVGMLAGVAANTALLLALAVLYDTLPVDWSHSSRSRAILAGCVIGAVGVVIMLTPWRYSAGVIFDTRSILLCTSGLFFGLTPTAIGVVMIAAMRVYQGGSGVYMGVGVIVTSAALGLLLRYYLARRERLPTWYELYGLGVVVHGLMLVWTFALPGDVRTEVLSIIALPVMLIYPVGTVLLGLLVIRREHLRRLRQSLQEERDLFEAIADTNPTGMVTVDAGGRIEYANTRAEAILGLSRDEITHRAYNEPGWKITDIDGGEFPEDLLPFRGVMDKKEPVRDVIHGIEWPNGERVLLSICAAPLRDQTGAVRKMVASVEDITERRATEKSLVESEDRFRRLSENAPDMIYRMSLPDGEYEYVSKASWEITGYSPQEFYDSPGLIQDIVHPDWQGYFEERWQELTQGVMPPAYEYQIVHSSGEMRWLNQRNILVRDENGAPTAIEGIVTDVTERKQAEASLRALASWREAVLTAVPDILVEVDNDKIYTWANAAALEFFGDDMIGKEAGYYFEGEQDTYQSVAPIFGGVEDVIYVESWQRRRDGEKRLLAWWCRAVTDGSGGVAGALSSARDITEQKEAERELHALNATLDLRVAQRTAELKAANSELEAFAYSVSHDLRAPLRAVSSFSQILTRRHVDLLNEEGREYLGHIVTAAEQMGRLIEDLLRYSRLGRHAVEIVPVDCAESLRQVLDQLAQAIGESGAKITVPHPLPVVNGDETLVAQILLNLLDNSIKYQPAKQKPLVEVTWERQDDQVVLKVKDNGLGIPAEHHERIFNVFQRLQSEADYPGTGVGLALVSRAAQLMRGEIGLESKPGKGSVFWVRLPAAPEEPTG